MSPDQRPAVNPEPNGGINITIHPVINDPPNLAYTVAEIRIAEHRRGEHPYGRMHRDCPMCVYG